LAKESTKQQEGHLATTALSRGMRYPSRKWVRPIG